MFASRAWLLTVRVEGSHREYCVDACLPRIVEAEWRALALVYPRGSCSHVKPKAGIILEDCLEAGELLSKLVESCRTLKQRVEELAELRGGILSAIASRKPKPVEEELFEARSALELCYTLFGEGLEASLVAARPAYIAYTAGSRELERVKSLSRLDGGVRSFLAGALS